MKRERRIILTTHKDRHGESLSPEGLDHMVSGMARRVLPVNIEHDPRIPPVGRILGARKCALDDGEWAIEADMELFDEGDSPERLGRQMPIAECPAGRSFVSYDRNFRDKDDLEDLEAIGKILRTRPNEEVKKSLDPIGVVIVGLGSMALAGVANGFLGALGKDMWEAMKQRLKALFGRRKQGELEKLLILSYVVGSGEDSYEIQLILTNPTDHDIDLALGSATQKIAVEMTPLLSPGIARYVFILEGSEVKLSFAVRHDAVPMTAGSSPARVKERPH